ncbi:MAG: phosphoribosylamine--glycine ligase [Deltaproteobacteria bacterium]|nr:phosphoribosylamine--glycine ligase [Deltaproteobacteria bacterium]
MRIAVLGSGGREHALSWRLRREGHEVVTFPGAPGIPGSESGVSLDDPNRLSEALGGFGAELVVIGPEAPLARGLADELRARGSTVLGPGSEAARLETSKLFAKKFMVRHGVKTPAFIEATDPAAARVALPQLESPVVKFDGLAAGKGVFVCADREEALRALELIEVRHGKDAPVVLEERLAGREVSVLAVVGGGRCVLLPPAQDHKRLRDGDQGPNTGGMGAVCPVAWLDSDGLSAITRDVVEPTLEGLLAEGIELRGVLYFGLMMTEAGPRLLEYNVRFGDPEAQVVLHRAGGSLAPVFLHAASAPGGRVVEVTRHPAEPGFTVGVVLASEGYPDQPRGGDLVTGLENCELVFHAGTTKTADGWVTSGGRVVLIAGAGATLREARAVAYAEVSKVRFRGMQLRRDIGGGSS